MKKLLPKLSVGTKSILYGVHSLYHPITVFLAWVELYGLPNLKELFCILIHDIGYCGKPDLNGDEGLKHPELAAKIAYRLFGAEYRDLCLYHSRNYAAMHNAAPSKLCWADKGSIKYEPSWLYLMRARASGELAYYRRESADGGYVSITESDKVWFCWIKSRQISLSKRSQLSNVGYKVSGSVN